MAASSSAVSDQASAIVAKNIVNITQPDQLQIQQNSAAQLHATILANSAPLIITANHPNSTNSELPILNCTNCDIKFDSADSLRVHLQVSPNTFCIYLPG